ncbi:hypothetical protein T492DRAFT_981796 [Pavlovales sp. CCMP2436]|nr:hypothetical protein T492DRAFT_981796 [Pavlovales sp. CCMP2436]|mmetsp:Transcript_17287/g.40017  ORF Transcript_17287/g.40017 Transcript_17287/m.40017 type:complete len:314 (+) Transcript_17287:1-942(+)
MARPTHHSAWLALACWLALAGGDERTATPTLDAEDEAILARQTRCAVQAAPARVVFNRIARTASTTMLTLMLSAARRKGFRVVGGNWTAARASVPPPYIYEAPLWYGDVSSEEGGLTWINMVRAPAKLFGSQYYYQRDCACKILPASTCPRELPNVANVIPHFCQMTIDHAVATWNATFRAGVLKSFFPGPGILVDVFCGTRDPTCHTDDMRAKYDIARRRVAGDYLFIGSVERLEESMLLQQRLLPTFYEGVDVRAFARLHANPGAKQLDPKPSLSTIREVQTALQWDVKLYAFIDRLLDQRLRACNLTRAE